MSATRDKSQKITFVYSNLYAVYRQGVERAHGARPFESGVVIKADNADGSDLAASSPSAPRPSVYVYTPAELIGKRVARPANLPVAAFPGAAFTEKEASEPATLQAVASLKDNLKSLNDLQARLRFMLRELEGLIKE